MTDSQGFEPVAVLCAECARGVLSLGWPVYVPLDWWREHVGVPDPAGAAAQFELLTGRSIADGEFPGRPPRSPRVPVPRSRCAPALAHLLAGGR